MVTLLFLDVLRTGCGCHYIVDVPTRGLVVVNHYADEPAANDDKAFLLAAQDKHTIFGDQFNKLVTAAAMGVAVSVRKEDPKRGPPSIWLRNGGPVDGSKSKCATLAFSCPSF